MVAEDILPLIEGDDDSLDTLMLGFERLGYCTLDNFAMKFGSQPSIPQIYPHQTSNVVTRFRYIGKDSMKIIASNWIEALRMLPVPGMLEDIELQSYGAEEMEYVCQCLQKNTSVTWGKKQILIYFIF